MQCTYNVTLRRVRLTIVAVEKAISIAYSQSVSLALVMRHAKRMRRIILSTVACLAVQNVSTLSHKRHYFRKNIYIYIERKLCFFDFLYNFCL